jgi:Chaperone for flagella basal body P-ring formation
MAVKKMRKAILWRVVGISGMMLFSFSAQAKDSARRNVFDLPARVTVEGPNLRLSDLLPENAPLQLREAAEKVMLGISPQPDSPRILSRQEIVFQLRNNPEILYALRFPERIVVQRESFPISISQVRTALEEFLTSHGYKTSWIQENIAVTVPDEICALEANASLEVLNLAWDLRHDGFQLRLRCTKDGTCGSFLARVSVPGDLPLVWHRDLGMPGPSQNMNRLARQMVHLLPFRIAQKPKETVLVQAGRQAILVMQGANIRITVPVICLQPGALSQEIRVRALTGQRVLTGEVIGAGMLQTSF